MSTQTTDFDTALIAMTRPEDISVSRRPDVFYRGREALDRIEASHAALITALEAILADEANRVLQTVPSQLINQSEAAIALAKGVAK